MVQQQSHIEHLSEAVGEINELLQTAEEITLGVEIVEEDTMVLPPPAQSRAQDEDVPSTLNAVDPVAELEKLEAKRDRMRRRADRKVSKALDAFTKLQQLESISGGHLERFGSPTAPESVYSIEPANGQGNLTAHEFAQAQQLTSLGRLRNNHSITRDLVHRRLCCGRKKKCLGEKQCTRTTLLLQKKCLC